MMAVGWNRIGPMLGAALLVAACSSDENGVLTADGSIVEVGAAGSAGSEADGAIAESGAGGASEAATGAEASDAATSDVSADGGLCNNIVQAGMLVTPTVSDAASPPVLTGGTITP